MESVQTVSKMVVEILDDGRQRFVVGSPFAVGAIKACMWLAELVWMRHGWSPPRPWLLRESDLQVHHMPLSGILRTSNKH
jgi:hypothetical protein